MLTRVNRFKSCTQVDVFFRQVVVLFVLKREGGLHVYFSFILMTVMIVGLDLLLGLLPLVSTSLQPLVCFAFPLCIASFIPVVGFYLGVARFESCLQKLVSWLHKMLLL